MRNWSWERWLACVWRKAAAENGVTLQHNQPNPCSSLANPNPQGESTPPLMHVCPPGLALVSEEENDNAVAANRRQNTAPGPSEKAKHGAVQVEKGLLQLQK